MASSAFPRTQREHFARLLSWSDAHVNFDEAIAGLPVGDRGRAPKGVPYSPWQLLEHIRLCQADILEFAVRRDYREKAFPADYWPASPSPPSAKSWTTSVAQVRRDLRALARLARTGRNLTARVAAGNGQTYLREILLAADHMAYHLGELIVVRRLQGNWPRPRR